MGKKKNFDGIVEESFAEGYHSEPESLTKRPEAVNIKYKFERDLAKNEMSIDVIDARRFGKAVKEAMHGLSVEARCYGLMYEPYYRETMAFLELMANRLTAKPKED